MIKFLIENNWTTVKIEDEPFNISNRAAAIINNICTHTFSEFQRSYGEIRHVERTLSLMESSKFPTGLINEVYKVISINFPDVILDVKDLRRIPERNPMPYTLSHNPDEKQSEAIRNGLEYDRGYFKMPTGAGKTNVLISLIGSLGGSSLIIEPSIDLVEQVSLDISKSLNQTVTNIMGRSSLDETPSNIIVASIDTLDVNFNILKEAGWFEQFDNLFLDEVHHSTFTKRKVVKEGKKIVKVIPPGFTAYYRVAMACTAYYRFGFTATPKEELFIKAITWEKLIEVEEDFLIENGRLSLPYIFLLKHKAEWFDEVQGSLTHIYSSPVRNAIIAETVKYLEKNGLSVLVMIDSVIHQVEILKELLPDHVFITGQTKSNERKVLYEKLANKEITSIILTVGKEGLNIPSVDCIIRGSGKKSETLITQEKGRGMRKAEGKDKLLLIDFFDNDGTKRVRKPGVGWRSKKGYLLKHSEQRKALYEATKSAKIFILEDIEALYLYIQKFINSDI